MVYHATDFAVAKDLAANLKQHLTELEAFETERLPHAVVSGGIVDSLRKALHDHGFDVNGNPIWPH